MTRPVWWFVVLTMVLSWPIGLYGFGFTHTALARTCCSATMMMMPTVAAVFVRRFIERRDFTDVGWRLGRPREYAAALGLCMLLWAVPALVDGLFGGARFDRSLPGSLWLVAGLSLLDPLPGFGEEFGWRGYLLPRLLQRHPSRIHRALLVSGIIWGIWHWPIVLGPVLHTWCNGLPAGTSWAEQTAEAVLSCITMVPAGIVLSYVFGVAWLSSRSIFVVSFLHGAYDATRDITAILTTGNKGIDAGVSLAMLAVAFVLAVVWVRRYSMRHRDHSHLLEVVPGASGPSEATATATHMSR